MVKPLDIVSVTQLHLNKQLTLHKTSLIQNITKDLDI